MSSNEVASDLGNVRLLGATDTGYLDEFPDLSSLQSKTPPLDYFCENHVDKPIEEFIMNAEDEDDFLVGCQSQTQSDTSIETCKDNNFSSNIPLFKIKPNMEVQEDSEILDEVERGTEQQSLTCDVMDDNKSLGNKYVSTGVKKQNDPNSDSIESSQLQECNQDELLSENNLATQKSDIYGDTDVSSCADNNDISRVSGLMADGISNQTLPKDNAMESIDIGLLQGIDASKYESSCVKDQNVSVSEITEVNNLQISETETFTRTKDTEESVSIDQNKDLLEQTTSESRPNTAHNNEQSSSDVIDHDLANANQIVSSSELPELSQQISETPGNKLTSVTNDNVGSADGSDLSDDEEYDFDIIGDIYSVNTSSIMEEWTNNDNDGNIIAEDDKNSCDRNTKNCNSDMSDAESDVNEETEIDIDVISDCDTTAKEMFDSEKSGAVSMEWEKTETPIEITRADDADKIDVFNNMKTCMSEGAIKTNVTSVQDDGSDRLEDVFDKTNAQNNANVDNTVSSDIEADDAVGVWNNNVTVNEHVFGSRIDGESFVDKQTLEDNDDNGDDEIEAQNTAKVNVTSGSDIVVGDEMVFLNNTSADIEHVEGSRVNNESVSNRSTLETNEGFKETEVSEDNIATVSETTESDKLENDPQANMEAESGALIIDDHLPSISTNLSESGKDDCAEKRDHSSEKVVNSESLQQSNEISTSGATVKQPVLFSVGDKKLGSERTTNLIITADGSIRLQATSSPSKDGAPDIGSHKLMVAPDQSNKMQLYMVPTKYTAGNENKVFMVLPSKGKGWAIKPNQMGVKSLVPVYDNKISEAEKDEKGNIKLVYTEGILLSKTDQNADPTQQNTDNTQRDTSLDQTESTVSGTDSSEKTMTTVGPIQLPQQKQTNQPKWVLRLPETDSVSMFNSALARTVAKTGVALYVPPKTSSIHNGVFVPIKKVNQKGNVSLEMGPKPKPLDSIIKLPSSCAIRQDFQQVDAKTVSILKSKQILLNTSSTQNAAKEMISPPAVMESSVAQKPGMHIKINSVFSLLPDETKLKTKDKAKSNENKIETNECYVVLQNLELDTKQATFRKDDLAKLDANMKLCSVQCRGDFVRGLFHSVDTSDCFTEEELDQLHIDTCTVGCRERNENISASHKLVLRSHFEKESFHSTMRKRKLGMSAHAQNISQAKMQRQNDGIITVLNSRNGRIVIPAQRVPAPRQVLKPGLQQGLLTTASKNLTFGDLASVKTTTLPAVSSTSVRIPGSKTLTFGDLAAMKAQFPAVVSAPGPTPVSKGSTFGDMATMKTPHTSVSSASTSIPISKNLTIGHLATVKTPLATVSSAPVAALGSKVHLGGNSGKTILILNRGQSAGVIPKTTVTTVKKVVSPPSTAQQKGNCVFWAHTPKVTKNETSSSNTVLPSASLPQLSNNPPVRLLGDIPKPGVSIVPRQLTTLPVPVGKTVSSVPKITANTAKTIPRLKTNSEISSKQKQADSTSLKTPAAKPAQKFYLIRVEDKNILMPMKNESLQPRAYVLDSKASGSLKTDASGAITLDQKVLSKIQNLNATSLAKEMPLHRINTTQSTKQSHPATISGTVSSSITPVPGGIKIKPEPKSKGYGDEQSTSGTFPVRIKAEPMNRGYSDEVPLNKPTSKQSHNYSSPVKSVNVVSDPKESNAKTKISQEERIRRLKELLKEQQKAVEEVRQKRTLPLGDI